MYILLRTQTWSRVWSFPNDRIYYTPQYTIAPARLRAATYGNSDNHFIGRDQKSPAREIVRYHRILYSWAFSKESRKSTSIRFHPRNRVLESVLHRSDLAGVTDVHCIMKGRTFHLQKKKVHNKSSDLPYYHPVAPASRVWESAENEISPRRDAARRLLRFQNSKEAASTTLHFGTGW